MVTGLLTGLARYQAMSTTKEVTRRAILSGAAALPAVAMLPTMAAAATTEPDPIFEAIKRHWKAFADFISLCRAEDALKEKGVKLLPAPGECRTPETHRHGYGGRERRTDPVWS
jgi:hypothetical protein